MRQRQSVAEMLSAFLRDAAALVVVFFPLEKLANQALTFSGLVKVLIIGFALWVVGVIIEVTRKE
jgi:hypothetical protein